MKIMKKYMLNKKVIAMLLLIITMLTNISPVFAVSGSGTFAGGQYASGMLTTDHAAGSTGVLIRRLINNTTGERYTVFCAEHGVDFKTGSSYNGNYYTPTDATIKRACKIAYFGWYKDNGGYVVDGGILANDMKWVKQAYVFTQQYIWETLGQSNATFRDSTVQANYVAFKNDINNKINNMQKRPSFDATTIEINAGETKVLNDTNGVLADYSSIDNTKDNVRFQHNKGENTLTISVSENCTVERLNISDNLFQSWGLVKEESKDQDTTVYFSFKTGVQNQLMALHYNDPVPMAMSLKINLFGKLDIGKKDNKGNYVPDTKFKISYNADMSNPIGTYTTGSNGKVLVDELRPGTVYIQETDVPKHLVLDTTIRSAIVKTAQTTSFEATNKWKQGRIQVVKKDAETNKVVNKAGTIFDISDSNNKKVASITTNEKGIATSELLDYGTYYVKESTAPNKYTIKVEVSENIGVVEDGKTYQITIVNTRVKGSVTISKEDTKTGKQAQGEATLEGAIYGIYARTPILDPADDTMIYNTDVKVAEMTTNKESNATMSNLYLGEYYIKEIKPSRGYNLDNTKYNFDLTYENQNVKVVTKHVTVKERVISQAFQIIKISSDEAGEAELLPSAEFTIKAQKDIEKYGSWDAAPITKNANGETASILKTDSKGYAISDRLPFGTYVVRETLVPEDKYKVEDFKIVISEDSDKPQTWRVFNDTSFTSVLAIVKKDAETEKVVKIEGASFKIKNLDTNEYFGYWEWNPLPHYVSTWTTNETGTVMTGDKLNVGNYQLEEIKGPKGYLISSQPVKFKISSSTASETLPDGKTSVITVDQKDTSVKGKITVEKCGEVLTDFKDGKFVYEEKGLANAKYEVFAREDIYDPSNDGTIIYKKGTVVDTIITKLDGKGTSKELPLGEYSVKEVNAPEGFVLSDEVKNVSLKYKDQNTAIVFDNTSFTNERQKVEINVYKKDAENDVGLLGATFGLYAKEEIKNYKDEIVVKAGTLIESATSDTEGKVHFTSDLPLTNFEIKEIQAPIGYASSNETIKVDATYRGQDTKIVDLEYEFKNKIIKVEVSKQDITDSTEIEGACLTVYEKDNPGAIFDTWISTKEPHLIKGLEVRKTYVLKETSAPYGFTISDNVEFTINDTGEIQSVIMKDELVLGKLKFNKYGEIFNQTIIGQNEFGKTESPIWNKSNLLNAEITIYANEDITIGNTTYYKKGEKVQTLESDWEAVLSKELPVGSYYYLETKVPHGYVADTNKHYFTIENTQVKEVQIIESTLTNIRAKVNIDMTKILEEQKIFINNEAYKDVVFGIYARENIYDYMGNVAIEKGTMIATSGITKEGTLENVPDLPNGVYYLKELATNSQYILNETEYDFEISYKGPSIIEYVVQIGKEGKIDNELARGTIQVKKVDTLDENIKLKNVEFNISTKEDMSNVITTEKTNEEGIATFNELELGTYYIQEAKQVDGYTLNNTIYKVEIKEDGDILIIACKNKPTEMVFSKVDETGTNELPGATIQIIEKETGNIIDEWVSTEENHKINYLTEGKEYTMKEITAPYGYEIAEEIDFVAGDGKKIIMKDMPILKSVRVEKLDKTTKEHIKSNKFIFGIYEDKDCTKLIKEAGANEYEGTALFEGLRYGTYYIKEIKAPLGYKLSEQVVKIEINEKGVLADGKALEEKDNVYGFVYYNSLLPSIQTGNESNYILLGSLALISLLGIVGGITILRKKYKEE